MRSMGTATAPRSMQPIQVGDKQYRRGDFARDTQQHNKIDVARPLDHDAGHRDCGQRGVDGREQPGETDEHDRAEQRRQVIHDSSKYRDLSTSR